MLDDAPRFLAASAPRIGNALGQRPLHAAAHQEGETMREAPTKHREAIADHRWFDWVMAVLSAWLLGGAFVDGWAHTHGKVDTTFFTPWHAAFYTGFLARGRRPCRGPRAPESPSGDVAAGATPRLQPRLAGSGDLWRAAGWEICSGIPSSGSKRMSRRCSAPRTSCWAVAAGSWSGGHSTPPGNA